MRETQFKRAQKQAMVAITATLCALSSAFAEPTVDARIAEIRSESLYKNTGQKYRDYFDLKALYTFKESEGDTTSQIKDQTTSPLHLDRVGGAYSFIPGGGIEIILQSTALISSAAATKIYNSCKASDELTVETWVTPFNEQPALASNDNEIGMELQPARIVSFSESQRFWNFFIGQIYAGGSSRYKVGLAFKPSAGADTDEEKAAEATNELDANSSFQTGPGQVSLINGAPGAPPGAPQRVVLSRSKDTLGRLFAGEPGRTNSSTILRERRRIGTTGFFNTRWSPNAKLAIGNEADVTAADLGILDNPTGSTTNVIQHKNRGFKGRIYMVAIFCKAMDEKAVLEGAAENNLDLSASCGGSAQMNLSENHKKALEIYARLNSTKICPDNKVIADMAADLSSGNAMEAAARATGERLASDGSIYPTKGFINITVRDFAARMSTRDETVNSTLNDFTATVMGIVKNNEDAKLMLTGNFTYKADTSKAAVPSDEVLDILKSNNHYEKLGSGRFDVADALIKSDIQKVIDSSGAASPNPDPAGLITTRAFMAAHAVAGTNRRLVEYSFREFTCKPIDGWADASGPDDRIGRDIDRFPGGSNEKYLVNCKSCHTGMDGFRGAFARFSFAQGFTLNSIRNSTARDDNDNPVFASGVAIKMNHNNYVFPDGFITTDDSWRNNAINASNSEYFGWGANSKQGYGVKAFGKMLSESRAFPECMAKRVYRAVCKRDVNSADPLEMQLIKNAAQDFTTTGQYKLRYLFKRIVTAPECLGSGARTPAGS